MRFVALIALAPALAGCAGAQAMRTSLDTMVIQASAAPACGGMGAARVAQKSAAIETLKAGYDRYIIFSGAAENNVAVVHGPGTVQTTGTMAYGGGFGTYNGVSTYIPGPTFVVGHHDQSLTVKMFHEGDLGAEQALSARDALGPDWAEQVKSRVMTCL
jgi:hypothetical protein